MPQKPAHPAPVAPSAHSHAATPVGRRTVIRTAAWSVPAVSLASAAPAFASSLPISINIEGTRSATVAVVDASFLLPTYTGDFKLGNRANTTWSMPALTRTVTSTGFGTYRSDWDYVFTSFDSTVQNDGQVPLENVQVQVVIPLSTNLDFGTSNVITTLRSTSSTWAFNGWQPVVDAGLDGIIGAGLLGALLTFTHPGTLAVGEVLDLEFFLHTTFSSGGLALPTLPSVGVTSGLPSPWGIATGDEVDGSRSDTDAEQLAAMDLFGN